MRHVIPPKFLLLYDIALQEFYQGKPPCKTFSFANFFIFTNQATTQWQSFAYTDLFKAEQTKKEASSEAPFSRYYSLKPLMNFKMTLVSDRLQVSEILCVRSPPADLTLYIFRNVVLALLELRQCT